MNHFDNLTQASIIGSATLWDLFHSPRGPKWLKHKGFMKSSLYANFRQVADAVIKARCRVGRSQGSGCGCRPPVFEFLTMPTPLQRQTLWPRRLLRLCRTG